MLTKTDTNFGGRAYKCLQTIFDEQQNRIEIMALFKATVRTPRKDGFYQVYIRVMQNRKPGYIKTDKVVTKKQLDREGNITDPFVTEYCARRILRFSELLNKVDGQADHRVCDEGGRGLVLL